LAQPLDIMKSSKASETHSSSSINLNSRFNHGNGLGAGPSRCCGRKKLRSFHPALQISQQCTGEPLLFATSRKSKLSIQSHTRIGDSCSAQEARTEEDSCAKSSNRRQDSGEEAKEEAGQESCQAEEGTDRKAKRGGEEESYSSTYERAQGTSSGTTKDEDDQCLCHFLVAKHHKGCWSSTVRRSSKRSCAQV
jgi:hypothetical protein